MLGNVWEWVQDCRAGDLALHPKDGSARLEGDCSQRGVRGGAWSTSAKGVRAATRGFYPVSRRDAAVGFRVAMTIKR
jgi:formylglycine-generating enzyme required for sulfatase activity